jgi:hypothetical protein
MHKARVRTLLALVSGMPSLTANPSLQKIRDEFAEVYAVRKVRRATRRRVLEVLHSTRALDTTLRAFVGHYGCRQPGKPLPNSLGPYLYALRDHSVAGLGHFTEAQRLHFYSKIAGPRNQYMHEAGVFPAADADVQALLSEMHACLSAVARL